MAFLQAAQSSIRQGMAAFPRLQGLLARYRDVRRSLRGSISRQSRLRLDWMNFFLADVQTGFGAFVAFYLADHGWPKSQVGLALAVGTISGVISQIPGGALIDALPWKRALAAVAACVFLFQVADASMLPVIGQNLAQDHDGPASVLMSGLIVAPQLVVGLLSPWVGHHSERFGRKPLLLLGFGLEIARALLFAFFTDYPILLLAQAIGGISAAAVTVLTILIITDLTTGTGRFNLVHGFFGTVIALAAAASQGATGFLFQAFGHWQGFMILAAVAAVATALLWTAMPETRPTKYLD